MICINILEIFGNGFINSIFYFAYFHRKNTNLNDFMITDFLMYICLRRIML